MASRRCAGATSWWPSCADWPNSACAASLLTNGIKASRDLLDELAAVGLTDVAFHVDTTQQRAGYTDEQALNRLTASRREYIERARGGLPISVSFNISVHAGNLGEVPMLAGFFVAQSDVVRSPRSNCMLRRVEACSAHALP